MADEALFKEKQKILNVDDNKIFLKMLFVVLVKLYNRLNIIMLKRFKWLHCFKLFVWSK